MRHAYLRVVCSFVCANHGPRLEILEASNSTSEPARTRAVRPEQRRADTHHAPAWSSTRGVAVSLLTKPDVRLELPHLKTSSTPLGLRGRHPRTTLGE